MAKGARATFNQDVILRGTDQQAATRNFLVEAPRRRMIGIPGIQGMPDSVLDWWAGLGLSRWELQNRSAGAIAVGIGFSWKNGIWIAGTWDDDGGTPFTDDTADAQDDGASDVPLFTDAVDNDGIVIAATRKFDWFSWEVGTATSGATSPITVLRYTNAAGTGWIDQTAGQSIVDNVTVSSAHLATGEDVFCWNPPHDWGRVTSAAGAGLSGIPDGYYAVNIRATTAPTTAGSLSAIELGSMVYSGEELANLGLWTSRAGEVFEDYDAIGIVTMFETAATGNMGNFNWYHAG